MCFMCLFVANRFLWLEVNDAALEGAGGGLGAVGYAEFSENVVDVAFNRGFADAQRTRNFFVGLAFHNFLKHLKLTNSKFRSVHSFREAFSNHRWKAAGSGMDFPDRVFQLFEEHVFQQIALCARLQGAVNVFIAVKSRKKG